MEKHLGLHFGALAEPIEKQLENQGFKITTEAIEKINKLNHARLTLLFGNCITDSENNKVCQRILNQLKKSVRPIY